MLDKGPEIAATLVTETVKIWTPHKTAKSASKLRALFLYEFEKFSFLAEKIAKVYSQNPILTW